MLTDPINETTSEDRQDDLFFLSADNNNVIARLTTDLFIKKLGRPASCRRTKSTLRLLNKSNRVE